MPAGRHTKYKPEYCNEVAEYSSAGMTDMEIADAFGVSVVTLWRWQGKYPEFRSALKEHKEIADNRVVKTLYEKALSGDTTAMIFWLKNRNSQQWRDRTQHELSGQVAVEYVAKSILDKGE
jgi:hypothetical protein